MCKEPTYVGPLDMVMCMIETLLQHIMSLSSCTKPIPYKKERQRYFLLYEIKS